MKAWAKTAFSIGMATLGYQWIYLPSCQMIGIQPWDLTLYGLFSIAAGFVLYIISASLMDA